MVSVRTIKLLMNPAYMQEIVAEDIQNLGLSRIDRRLPVFAALEQLTVVRPYLERATHALVNNTKPTLL